MLWAFSASFQKSGAAARSSSSAMRASRSATSKMPPETVEAFLKGGDAVFQREVFHVVSTYT